MCNHAYYDAITMKAFTQSTDSELFIFGTLWKDGVVQSGFHHEMSAQRLKQLLNQAFTLGHTYLDFTVAMEKLVEVHGVDAAVSAMLENRHADRNAAEAALQFRMIGAAEWI